MAKRRFSGKSGSLLPRIGGNGHKRLKKEVASALRPLTARPARKPKRMRPLLGLL